MNWWARLLGKNRLERQLDAELRFHLDQRVQSHVAAGLSENEARRLALLEFGGVDSIKEECREARGTKWVEDGVQDLRYAGRVFRRDRLFTAVVVLSLALGIGANTALFSVIDARFLRELPVEKPDELVFFQWRADRWTPRGDLSGTFGSGGNTPFSAPMFAAFRNVGDPLSDVFASSTTPYGASALIDGQAKSVSMQFVSGNFFSGLGTTALAGRTIQDDDDRLPADGVGMISHQFWQRHFDADIDVLGKSIRLNGTSIVIIGVLPRGFRGVASYSTATSDIWIPLSLAGQIVGRKSEDWWLHVMGRMAPERTPEQVRGKLEGTLRGLTLAAGDTLPSDMRFEVLSGSRGIPEGGSDRLFIGLIIAGFVLSLLLLIVCLNVANLLLARSAVRQYEIEVRRAMGASRVRLIRQLLTESVLLALAGGTLGVIFAVWAKDLFSLVPSFGEELDLRIDTRVLGFTALVSLGTSIVFGLAPALQATRARVSLAVGRGIRSFEGLDSRVGKSLLVFQVATSVVLLVGAILLVRTLGFWRAADPGFNTNNLMVFEISPANLRYDETRSHLLFNRINAEIRTIPGVTSTSMSDPFFGSGGASDDQRVYFGPANIFVTDVPGPRRIQVRSVAPDFFETLNVPILRGRSFRSSDDVNGPLYAAVDETLARALFGNADPIGRRFGFSAERRREIEIVGIAKDVQVPGAFRGEGPRPMVYLPQFAALARTGHVSVEVRSTVDPSALAGAIRRTVGEIDRDLPIEAIKTMNQAMTEQLAPVRHLTVAWTVFTGVALLLTCIGLYGLMAYFVERHTREIGIRIALGAKHVDVVRLVLRRCLLPVLAGLVVGLALSWPVHQIIRSLIYGKTLYDPVTFSVVISVLLAVASIAGYLPARRAASADPTAALRQE